MWVFLKLLHRTFLLIIQSRWVDRDMFMRFRGGGIGHKILRDAERQLNETDPWVGIEEGSDVAMGDGAAAAAPVNSDDDDDDAERSDEGGENEHIEDDDEDDDLGAEDGEAPDYIAQEDQYDEI
jgi:hypothetical protein